jgi:hypothetical protein
VYVSFKGRVCANTNIDAKIGSDLCATYTLNELEIAASCKRRVVRDEVNGTQCPGGITGPPCSRGIYVNTVTWPDYAANNRTVLSSESTSQREQDRKFQTATFRQQVISGRKSHKGARYQDILTD